MRKTLLFILLISLVINSGCIHRKLTIKSDPPGATVYFNDKEIGTTPLEFDFMYYANHRVRLEKDGYETLKTMERIKTPPRLWIPLDLIAELMPVKVEDYYEFSYELIPKTAEEEPIP